MLTKNRIKEIHAKYERLCQKDDESDAKLFYLKHRNILGNYDNQGNWVGPTAYENGWTP